MRSQCHWIKKEKSNGLQVIIFDSMFVNAQSCCACILPIHLNSHLVYKTSRPFLHALESPYCLSVLEELVIWTGPCAVAESENLARGSHYVERNSFLKSTT